MLTRLFFPLITIVCLLTACSEKDDLTIKDIALETYTLPGDTLFPEGIAYNPGTGLFYTGSVSSGDILQVNVRTGVATLISVGAGQNRRAATGMKIDQRNRLWVCGGGDNKIHVLNLDGSLIRSWDTRALFGSGFINDCIISNGYVYFTDSQVRKIYRISSTETYPANPEEWLTFTDAQIPYATGTSANGIETTPDNKYLVMVVSNSGKLYRIEIATKAITEIALNTPVTAGDGLYLNGNTLFVSRNSTGQIFPVTLNADYTQGTVGSGFGTGLLFNTTMARAGDYLLVVNGQLNRRTPTPTPVLPFKVSRVAFP